MADYGVGGPREPLLDGGLQPATRADVERLEASLREVLMVAQEMASRQDTVDRRIQQIEAIVTQLAMQLAAPPSAAPSPARNGPRRARTSTRRSGAPARETERARRARQPSRQARSAGKSGSKPR